MCQLCFEVLVDRDSASLLPWAPSRAACVLWARSRDREGGRRDKEAMKQTTTSGRTVGRQSSRM